MSKTISIITPWKGHPELIADYEAAVQGAEVVTVDNSIDGDVASELLRMTERLGGVYIRNTLPAGFAFSNNQGLHEASGDIILFLNNDIRAESEWLERAREDVLDSALYGPSLGHENVYGFVLPYIEGWCVAARKGVWDSLKGWDAQAFRDFYWEDADLSFRATQRGSNLIQTKWPVSHKGGKTINGMIVHGEAYERNRAIFAARVKKFRESMLRQERTPAQRRLQQLLSIPSDMRDHLPLLFTLARGNVLELGVRTGNSTCALLAGVEIHQGHVWSVDSDPGCADVFPGHSQWNYLCADSRDPLLVQQIPESLDVLLVDTQHTYAQVMSELDLWAPKVKPGGTICVHDTETFPETRKAVEEYCSICQWSPRFLAASHGMAVIEAPLYAMNSKVPLKEGNPTEQNQNVECMNVESVK